MIKGYINMLYKRNWIIKRFWKKIYPKKRKKIKFCVSRIRLCTQKSQFLHAKNLFLWEKTASKSFLTHKWNQSTSHVQQCVLSQFYWKSLKQSTDKFCTSYTLSKKDTETSKNLNIQCRKSTVCAILLSMNLGQWKIKTQLFICLLLSKIFVLYLLSYP